MIQRTRHRFDAVGNMTARERFRPWVINPDGSGYLADSEQVTERFTYGGLDRDTMYFRMEACKVRLLVLFMRAATLMTT